MQNGAVMSEAASMEETNYRYMLTIPNLFATESWKEGSNKVMGTKQVRPILDLLSTMHSISVGTC